MVGKQDIKIKCADDFELAATIYKPDSSIKAAIMIAPATGIKRGFYNSFATYLAENAYGVICFDNRGIGDSKSGNINSVDASLINWGKLDMTSVLQALEANFPQQNYHLIGHSAGGQLVGLMENATKIKSMFNFASSSGSLKNMQYPFKFSAWFFLNLYIPFNNLLFGKTNSQWIGMGEPLPKKVARQWQKWCNSKGYVEADFGKEIKKHNFYDLYFPSMWLYATDDGIANYKNVKDMTRIYSNSKVSITEIDPKKLGKKSLDHMGFFSSKNKDLWQQAINWFDANN